MTFIRPRASWAPSPERGGRSARFGPFDDLRDERVAGVDLRTRHELVGLVSLRDVAGTADHGRHAMAAEDAGLGAVGHAIGPVAAGPFEGELCGLEILVRIEGG